MHVSAERIHVKSYNMLEEPQKSFTWPQREKSGAGATAKDRA